jgi:TonB family protein
VVQRIEFVGLSPELQQRVQERLTVREGDTLGGGDLARLQNEMRLIDEHLMVGMFGATINDRLFQNVILRFMLGPNVTATLAPGAYRIGGGVSAPIPILRPEPEYSEQARRAKWQGAVLLQIVIDENGVPQDIQVIRPLGMGLDQKAVEAVQKWRFKPTLLNGQPVPVSANIEVNFHL